ncbi:MAG TPA: hypothetical protein VGK16_09810 [Candidatus Limnocylindrales bacterium]
MADDKGTSQLFGESLPGTGGDFIDTNDVEGHMGNKYGTPVPPSADGEPDDFSNKPLYRDFDGGTEDTEGHRRGPGGNIPNADGSPDDFSNKPLYRDFDGGTEDDVEGHGFAKRAPGENPHGDR